MADIRAHGHNFLVPLGKHMTLDEENVEVRLSYPTKLPLFSLSPN